MVPGDNIANEKTGSFYSALTSKEKDFLIIVLRKFFFDNLGSGLKAREVREKRTQPPLL